MRTLTELRELLLKTIKEVKDGKVDVQKANAMCSMANSVINLTRLEMDYLITCEKEINFIKEDYNIETSLEEIEERNKKPYEIGK